MRLSTPNSYTRFLSLLPGNVVLSLDTTTSQSASTLILSAECAAVIQVVDTLDPLSK
eukprot:c49000_g1_i1 orf=43-213(+)